MGPMDPRGLGPIQKIDEDKDKERKTKKEDKERKKN